jgi:hypothetical protein
MRYVKAVEAALRATTPFVAIPVEGHAPACVRAKLLKGALKGVTITSVKIITADAVTTSDSGRWLEIKGRAEGGVRTSCKMVVLNRRCPLVVTAMWDWAAKERKKRVAVINQGVLNPTERKALKLKEAMAKEEKRRNAELIAAQREESYIIEKAKASIAPDITPLGTEERAAIMAEYAQFRACRHVRKRGSVIRWKIKSLEAEVDKITVLKGRSRFNKKRELRKQKDKLRYMALIYQIGELEAKFKVLYPKVWRKWEYADGEDHGYWVDSFQAKRPNRQTYQVTWKWSDENSEQLQRLAERLKKARAEIRALTPPDDEEEIAIAA